MNHRSLLSCIVVASLAGLGSTAWAEGLGVRAGDLVFHPHAWVGGGYDSNVFLESPDDATAINDAIVLKVGGGLGLKNRSPNKVAIDLDTRLTYRHFTAINNLQPEAADLVSSRNAISDAGARGKLVLLPRAPVSVSLHEDFTYSERPPYSEREGLAASSRLNNGQVQGILGYNRIGNAVGIDLAFHPGPPDTRALEMRLGYRFRLIRFLDAEALGASRANRNSHELQFRTSWKFLPKTAAEFTVDYHVNDFEQPLIVVDAAAPPVLSDNRDNRPLRAQVGLKGLLTKRLSTVLEVGYANSFNVDGDSYSMAIGRLELRYVLEPTLQARIGYQRSVNPTAFSNFVSVDRVFASSTLNFLQVFALTVSGEFGYYAYSQAGSPTVVLGDGTSQSVERTDPLARAQVELGYTARDWLRVQASWRLDANLTGYATPLLTGTVVDHADYSRQQFMLEVRAHY